MPTRSAAPPRSCRAPSPPASRARRSTSTRATTRWASRSPEARMAEPVLIRETRERVATWTLNRPEALNALDTELLAELGEACREVDADPGARAVVVTGAGRASCPRGDGQGPTLTTGTAPARH